MSDFISRTALLGYLSKKCAEKDYTTSDMISDIQRFGIDGEVTPLPKMKKDFEIIANLKSFGGWGFRQYPMTREEADYVVNALEELKRYKGTGLSVEQLGWIDEEYQELAKKVAKYEELRGE